MARFFILACVCFLGTGLVLGQERCAFTEMNKGLSQKSWDAGANYSAHLADISDESECREVCCTREDCQLALIETPADGLPQCFLVNCMKDGTDVCVFEDSEHSKVYVKTQVSDRSNSSTDYCRFEKEVGPCRASFPRFYFDVTDQTCKLFVYGGCGGNSNNFQTVEECQNACSGVTGDVLTDTSASPKFRKTLSQDLTVKIVDSTQENHNLEYQEACVVEADSGPCRAAFRMFYFEPSTQSCQQFIYGGCKGNKNRYSTLEECMSNCAGKGGFEEHEGHRARWTPAFFLVASLAIMSVVLLVGLLMISVRRVKHQRHLLLDDKQELLPGEHIPEEVLTDSH